LLFALEGESDPWHQPEKAQVDTRQFEMLSV
jgi:nitrite reductase (NADH) large subunit